MKKNTLVTVAVVAVAAAAVYYFYQKSKQVPSTAPVITGGGSGTPGATGGTDYSHYLDQASSYWDQLSHLFGGG